MTDCLHDAPLRWLLSRPMRFRSATILVLLMGLAVPAIAPAKVLTTARTKTEANPSLNASGFLTFPKDFRLRVSASGNMKINGSVVTIQCNRGETTRTKFIGLSGKNRVNKKIRPSLKDPNACSVFVSVVGDEPGRLRIRLTGRDQPPPEPPAETPA